MNDDFLHRLRTEPPPTFAARLKAKLDRQSPQRSKFSVVRSLVLGLLVGGSAVAATWWIAQGHGSEELRAAMSRVIGSSSRTSQPASPDATLQQRSFFGSVPVEETSSAESVPVSTASVRAASPEARADGTVAANPAHDGVIGGYAKSTRSTRGEADDLRDSPPVRAAGHESGLMVVKAVSGRSGMIDLMLEEAEDEEAFRRLCTSQRAEVVVTTRSITEDEMSLCRTTLGYRAEYIKALKLGHIGVAISAAKLGTSSTLSPREIFLALAKRVPDPENPARFIPNANVSWHQVGPYQERRITFFGPERDSPLAEVFAALILDAGCDTFASIKALRETDPDEYRRLCHEIRDDSVYTPVHESEFFLTQRLWGDPHALAVLSLPFFETHRAELSGSLLSGPTPTPETIASGTYEGAITLFIYARDDTAAGWVHRDFEQALRTPSYFARYGLVLATAEEAR